MPQQAPQQAAPQPTASSNISNQIQQMVGAQEPPSQNMASSILANRFQDGGSIFDRLPNQDQMQQVRQAFTATPNAGDYANSISSILTGKYQTGQDIANANQQSAYGDLSNFMMAPLKTAEIQSEIDKNESGRFQPVKDVFGNVTGVMNGKTGEVTPMNMLSPQATQAVDGLTGSSPSPNPQVAAQQILSEQGSVPSQVMTRQDVTGRNQQDMAYRNQANGAKSIIQQLNSLNSETGQYTPGGFANDYLYGPETYLGAAGTGATARTEADKASKTLANSFMTANAGSKGAGIRMVEFDAGAVPNADMSDEARTDLIAKNTAIANSQIQRGVISSLYPRMQVSNVNDIMDNYETKNPPVLPTGKANPSWMPYQQWLSAGRPNTAVQALQSNAPTSANNLAQTTGADVPRANDRQAALQAEARRRGLIQ